MPGPAQPTPSSAHRSPEELARLPTSALVAHFEALWGHSPRRHYRSWLIKRILFKAEEARLGGLSGLARQRLACLMAEVVLPLSDPNGARHGAPEGPVPDPIIGAAVSRVWRGQEHRATRIEGGWEYEDEVFRSLSAVAKHITGAHWNGRAFFGLTRRKPQRRKR